MSTPPPEHEHAQHRCPECGGDATRKRDRHPFTVVGSRLRLWTLCGVLLAVYVGVMVAGSDWRVYKTGPQHQSASQLQGSFNPNANIVRGEVTADSRTLADLKDALSGDEQLLDAFIADLREATKPFDHYGNRVSPQRIRLDLESPEFEEKHILNYQFLGHLVGFSTWQVYETAAKQVPVMPLKGSPQRTQVHWWPTLHMQIDAPLGEHGVTYSVNYINGLTLLVLSVLLASAFASLLRRLGVRPARSKWFRVIASGVLVFGVGVGAFLNPWVIDDTSQRYFRPIQTGTWYTPDSIRSELDDPARAAVLIREMTSFGGFVHYDPALAITIARELEPNAASANTSAITASSSGFRLQLPVVGQTLSYHYARYTDAGTQQPQTRSWWNDLLDHGWMNFTRNTPQNQHMARINILSAVLILATPWLLWRATNAVYNLRTVHRQRRRVNRGQCIYCAYKLPPEALAARWEDAPLPS